MTPLLSVRIYGNPFPWSRPRARRAGPFIRFFEKPEQVDWKRTVVAQVLPVKPDTPSEDALRVRATFHVLRPKSLPKRVQHPKKKPDASNLIKSVEDCLNGIVWKDDAQIVALEVWKVFSESPGVEIEVWSLENCGKEAVAR